MAAKTVRAISVKTVGIEPKHIFKLDDAIKSMFAARIVGRVTHIITDERPDGTLYDALAGKFEATNADGEVYQSGRCFLPIGFDEGIINSFKTPQKDDKGNELPQSEVQFVVDVYVIRATNAQGYSYSMESVHEVQATPENDPLYALRQIAASKPLPPKALQLAAPSTGAEVAGKPEAETAKVETKKAETAKK